MRWPTNKEQHAHMRKMVKINKKACKTNRAENWFWDKLKKSGHKWTRQAQWGYRIFDFWCAELGIAVEIDGTGHNVVYDRIKDDNNYLKSGIVVLRIKNFNEDQARKVLADLDEACTWNERRSMLGLEEIKMKKKKAKL